MRIIILNYSLSWTQLKTFAVSKHPETFVSDESVACSDSVDFAITSLVTNCFRARPGSLFIGLLGSRINGGLCWASAVRQGAVGLVLSADLFNPANLPPVPTLFIRQDSLLELAGEISAYFYSDPTKSLILAGVTGTNGKTTTTHLLEHLLKSADREVALFGTLYQRWKNYSRNAAHTTLFALELQTQLEAARTVGCTHAVMEVSSHSLVQQRVAGCKFDVAVWTNLTQDHLDYHGTMEAYYQAKRLLFTEKYLGVDGAYVVNLDDEYGQRLALELASSPNLGWGYTLHFGQTQNSARLINIVAGEILTSDSARTRVRIATPEGGIEVNTPLLGNYNVENILAATAAALALKVPLETIASALSNCYPPKGRLNLVPKINSTDPTVLIDYAHTPDGLQKVLQTLRPLTTGKLWCVFGCGGDRDKTKRPLMGEIAANIADVLVLTTDNPRTEPPLKIIEDIQNGINIPAKPHLRVFTQIKRAEAIRLALTRAQPKDLVLIAGKGHEDYQIWGTEKEPFDDFEVAKETLTTL